MAHICGHVLIAAPPEQVFDIVAGSRNELSSNTAMTEVELLTCSAECLDRARVRAQRYRQHVQRVSNLRITASPTRR